MSVLIQHGSGKSDKIEKALDRGIADGVVLHPRFEQPDRLETYVFALRNRYGDESVLVIDPHFFLATYPSAPLGNLPDYPYFQVGLSRRELTGAASIGRHVKAVLDFQVRMPVSRLITPSIYVDDLSGHWSQIALNLAAESLDYHQGMDEGVPPLWLAFAIDEAALTSKDAIDEFLDTVSAWEPAGFLLTVNKRDDGYPAVYQEGPLQHLLYINYVLGERAGFEVANTYSDLDGFLLQAAGGTYSATGWHNSQRRFPSAWLRARRPGGQPRNARYTSVPLINSILVVPELETISDVGSLARVLSGTQEDHVFASGRPSAATWPGPIAFLHHMECCHQLCARIPSGFEAGLTEAEAMLQRALVLYDDLEANGVRFGPTTGSRGLQVWSQALASFRADGRV